MKKILICGLVLLSIFIIYLANMDKKVYYLALGNSNKNINENTKGYSYYVKEYLKNKKVLEKYIYEYSDNNKRIPDIIQDIKENKKINKNTLKNSLIKADLVTISINADDVFDKLKDEDILYNEIYDYIDDLTIDLEKLFKLMRQYCKEDIIFVGYYNPYIETNDSNIRDIVDYINKRYKETAHEYNIKYVDISDLNKTYIKDTKLTSEGYKKISYKIIKAVNKSLFEG